MSKTRSDFADVAAGLVIGFFGAAACCVGVGFAVMAGFWPGWIVTAAGLAAIYYGLYRLAR